MTVGVLAYVPVVTSIPLIALTAYAGHAQALHPASLVLTAHSGARFAAAVGRNEFTANQSDAAAPGWAWRLAGTILAQNVRMALFAQQGRTRAVQEGNAIDGWIVTSVETGTVTLSAAGEIRVLHLEGMSRDEAADPHRPPTGKAARANAAVLETSRQHDMELEKATRDLLEATRRMTRR